MNSHPFHLLTPVFRFLDNLIHEHGDYAVSEVGRRLLGSGPVVQAMLEQGQPNQAAA